jgi:NADP-dependent 3-hydroxy acid dehydrogenase YdfG
MISIFENVSYFELAFITFPGASSGIGEATALLLSTYGMKLVIAARNEEKLKSVSQECQAKGLSSDKVDVICTYHYVVSDPHRVTLADFDSTN